MTSQSKFKLIMGVLVVLLLLGVGSLVGSYFLFPGLFGGNVNQTNTGINTNGITNGTNQVFNTNNTLDNTNTVVVENTNTNIPTGEPIPDENRILALGRSFTERYGSFSNQNEFENLSRLLIYMTSKLRQDTQAFITEQEGKQASTDPYYGVTTDVASISIESFEDKRAVVIVETRRRQSREGESTTVFSQSARLVMVKQNGEWLVDKFQWQ